MAEQQPLVVRLLSAVSDGPEAVLREVQAVPARLAEQRTRLEQQIKVAHWIGEMAVSVGTREVGKRLSALRTPVAASPLESSGATSERGHAPPFDGYDDLPAPEIVRLLAKLPRTDLALIREYEAAHRARRTILNRLEQALS